MPGAEVDGRVLVLDASIAVRWVVSERGSDEAARLLDEPVHWLAPRLMLVESAGALRRKVERGGIGIELAAQALEALLQAVADGVIRLAADEELVAPALMLALALEHKLPDCLYLALAEREGAGLATADRRLGSLAARRGVPTELVPSG